MSEWLRPTLYRYTIINDVNVHYTIMECVGVFTLALVIVVLNGGAEAGSCNKLERSLSQKLFEILYTINSGGKIEKKTISDKLIEMLYAIKSRDQIEDENTEINKPAFSVQLTGNPVKLTGFGPLLKFNNVILNRGNVYNPNTGKFTAPITGLYQFSVTVLSLGRGGLHMSLHRNEKLIVPLFGALINGGTETANPVLELTKGDTVELRHYRSIKETVHPYYTYMSGYYIGK